MLCAACVSLEPAGALLAMEVIEPGLPPWQRADREFFLAHPQRHIRLREPFPDEMQSLRPWATRPAQTPVPGPEECGAETTGTYIEAIKSALNLADGDVVTQVDHPLILVIRFGADYRVRHPVVGRGPPYGPYFLDSLACRVERLCPAPTEAEAATARAEMIGAATARARGALTAIAAVAAPMRHG